MTDWTAWLEEYRAMALGLFGERVRFLGLQGSRARGEAGPDSDIDVVLVLDRLEPEDLERYRRGLGGLPDRALVCGFCSGAEELRNWDRGDRFQFWYDTVPLLGRLEDIFPAPDRSDARRAALAGACALYHLCVHNSLHGRDPNVLRNAGKSARFALQAAHFARTGVYLRRREDLDAGLAGADAALWAALRAEGDPDSLAAALLRWCGGILRTFGPSQQ